MKKRYLAGLIDFVIASLVQAILMFQFILSPRLAGALDSGQIVIRNLGITGVSMAYMIVRDILGTRSLGKRIMKLQITSTKDTKKASFLSRFVRNITWIIGPVDVLVLLVAKKRIGDMLAKTNVEPVLPPNSLEVSKP